MPILIPVEIQRLQVTASGYLKSHWKTFLAEGIFFVIIGTLAVMIPHLFTLGITLFLGWILLVGGLVQMIRAIAVYHMPSFSLWLIIGLLQIIIGYFLLREPTEGSLTLTLLLTVFFLMEGLSKIYLGFMMRPLTHWNWMCFSGIAAICMAVIVWSGLPGTATWVIGLLLGINMIILGGSIIQISLHYKDQA